MKSGISGMMYLVVVCRKSKRQTCHPTSTAMDPASNASRLKIRYGRRILKHVRFFLPPLPMSHASLQSVLRVLKKRPPLRPPVAPVGQNCKGQETVLTGAAALFRRRKIVRGPPPRSHHKTVRSARQICGDQGYSRILEYCCRRNEGRSHLRFASLRLGHEVQGACSSPSLMLLF